MRLKNALGRLAESILALAEPAWGPEAWGKTAVAAVTEFGRTVRENGTGGTDHGTGGAMLLAGGASPRRPGAGPLAGAGGGGSL